MSRTAKTKAAKAPEWIIAIDPGPTTSGVVEYDARARHVLKTVATAANEGVLTWLRAEGAYAKNRVLVVEMIQPMGMPLGWSTILTSVWTGRFIEAWGGEWDYLQRAAVKRTICGAGGQAKDANIRQALIDRFGGDRKTAIGTKKEPGPLYGVTSHAWSALAVGIAWAEGARVER